MEQRKPLEYLSQLLKFPPPLPCQDWWLEMADENRIAEFCDVYESAELTDIEKFCLMELITASYEDYLVDEHNEVLWERIARLLRQDWNLNKATVEYWSLFDEDDPANVFRPTPFMRLLWNEMESS